ncbi:MAG TPA: class I SAM-dependent methyltransferase [Thermomicrobiales bacterium]|nr:class I SAM-dependent methyltransferase [Thermomicrobiales bacterium]
MADIRTTPDILDHYASGYERVRLLTGPSQLELARTQELLTRYLPPPPAVILDVGGGPGTYARWLAGQGYEVHLVDPVPIHVEEATRAGGDPPLASARIGDARHVDYPDASADVVLLMGPLYHLTERADRLLALREAARIVRPGGLVFAVGIARFTSLLDGLSSGYLDDPDFVAIVERDLRDGQHRNPGNHPGYFTTAYFHHPDELRDEALEAGLSVTETVAIEGPGHWVPRDFDAWWDDPNRRERLLAAVRAVESEPSLIGLGPHFMVIARRDT